jgi:transposase InsO family protein
MTENEFAEYESKRKKQISPAFKLAAYLGGLFFDEVLVDIGADCNLIDLETAKRIVRATEGSLIRTDKNSTTITGVAGKMNIDGYLLVSIDLGSGVVFEDVIFVADRIFGGTSKMLLGKPYLSVIDATIGVRGDYLSVPSDDGRPVLIHGRRYLGNGIWDRTKLERSAHRVITEERIKKGRQSYLADCTTAERYLVDRNGKYVHPWAAMSYCCNTESGPRGVGPGVRNFVSDVSLHIVSEAEDTIPMEVTADYTEESAQLEGLQAMQVDDVTWWVCLEDVSERQLERLQSILRKYRPFVAKSVLEMKHCPEQVIRHDLIPREGAVWQIAKRRKQLAPLEMQWVRTYVGSLLDAGIVSPVDTGQVFDNERGELVPIQQTSNVTLAPKGDGSYRLCISYIHLNRQLHKHVWEIRNLEECVRRQAGNLRFSGVDGFSGFFAIPMGLNKHLTAFVLPGWGVFTWNYLPFGLQGGPSTYSRLIWKAFASFVGDNLQVYLDNIDFADGKRRVTWKDGKCGYERIDESRAIDMQLDRLEFCIFPQFEKFNMSVNPAKSPLLAKTKKTLGHVISRNGMTKSPAMVSKFQGILREPVEHPDQLERNLACLRYLARYIPNLASKTKFISDKLRGWKTYVDPPAGKVLPKGRKKMRVLKDGYSFHWNDTDQAKLLALSEELGREITLQAFSEMLPIVMMMDASPWAISCVIGQLSQAEGIHSLPKSDDVVPDGSNTVGNLARSHREAKPIMFLSKVLNDTQSRWSQPEKEAFAIYWFLTQNRHLLLGSKIYIYSDCKPMAQAFQMSSTNAKVNGWILSLQEFDYEIFHITGKSNIVADSLSRIPKDLLLKMEEEENQAVKKLHPEPKKIRIVTRGEEGDMEAFAMGGDSGLGKLSKERWKQWRKALIEYMHDGTFGRVTGKADRRRLRHMATRFVLEESKAEGAGDLLYRNRHEKYVPVPKCKDDIDQILLHFHDQPCAGHYAAEMTFRKIYESYYWPTIRGDVWKYVKSCDSCQRAQDLAEYRVEPLRPIVCLEPFELVHIDYAGPYEPSKGKRHCLYIIDAFTGWLEIVPTAVANGKATIEALTRFCHRFGYPLVLHSDRGAHFHNHECLEWAADKGIKWVFGAPGQAKGQGKVERAIRTIKASIRRMADEDPRAWVELIPQVQCSFNGRFPYREPTLSPSQLLMGYLPRNEVLNLVEPQIGMKLSLEEPAVDKLRELRLARLDAYREEAVTLQIHKWTRRVEEYDRGLRAHAYEVGDLVLYQNYGLKTQHGNPWKYRWKGPVEIVHITKKGKLHLKHPETGGLMKGWHSDKIRPYILREGSVASELLDSETL